MAILKCKMCGGDVSLSEDRTVGMCEYCGCTMTFPKIDDDQRAAAFNRGNHFRRIGEFDKALAVYERIVREDENDAEAHWCCALCRFGIEYVEDPATMEWLPTCHRASFDSFLEDVDYLAAVAHSEGLTQRQYQKDAAKIAEVQRGILATSQNAEVYDVFICYKETDEKGQRTVDSTLAQEIYYQLTELGRSVFFARISLEDVVGTQYEPFIFAALNSAKVMIVVGTKPEYLSAVWVKNEWSRFLAMMKKDRHKLLLPCYRDMDPYDLPEQLSVLQSYDMAKIGFIQDLIRGVSKVLDAQKKPAAAVKETVVVNQTAPGNIDILLDRGQMALEDGEWAEADRFFEDALNIDPRSGAAYLGKLMADLQVSKPEDIPLSAVEPAESAYYAKVMRFGDGDIRRSLERWNAEHIRRVAALQREAQYQEAVQAMQCAKSSRSYTAAANQFEAMGDYMDALQAKEQCYQYAAECRIVEEKRRKYIVIAAAICAVLAVVIGIFASNEAKGTKAYVEATEQYSYANELYSAVWNMYNYYDTGATPEVVDAYWAAYDALIALDGYKDSAEIANECINKIYSCAEEMEETQRDAQAAVVYGQLYSHQRWDCWESAWRCWNEAASRETFDISSPSNAIAVKNDGSVVTAGWLDDDTKAAVSTWQNIVAVGSGWGYVVGLQNDGTVLLAADDAQSYELSGEKWKNIVSISTGVAGIAGVRIDGTVVVAMNSDIAPEVTASWTNIVDVEVGSNFVAGLKSDGSVVVAMTFNYNTPVDVSNWTNIKYISAGGQWLAGVSAKNEVLLAGEYDERLEEKLEQNIYYLEVAYGGQAVLAWKNGTYRVIWNGYQDTYNDQWAHFYDIDAVAADGSVALALRDGVVIAVGKTGLEGETEFVGEWDLSEFQYIRTPSYVWLCTTPSKDD